MYNLATHGILALDGRLSEDALTLAETLTGEFYGFKINDAIYGDLSSDSLIRKLSDLGFVFADVKAHDIPNTVASTIAKLAASGAHLITVHASGGEDMVRSAVSEYANQNPDGLGILCVTVLTSLSDADCGAIYGRTRNDMVLRFAEIAAKAGAYGIVCSAKEAALVRDRFPQLRRVVPGTRLIGGAHDQKNVVTPRHAFADGADLLVVGRDISQAENPLEAIRKYNEHIAVTG